MSFSGHSYAFGTAMFCAALALSAPHGFAASETTLYAFQGGTDGNLPVSVIAVNGALYGTTWGGGGDADGGIAFGLAPPAGGQSNWTETVIHSFTCNLDGCTPNGLVNVNGSLFGTTQSGGSNYNLCTHGCGVFYELTPPVSENQPWSFTTLLASFEALPDTPLEDVNGQLYGSAAQGGYDCGASIIGCGVEFQLTPPSQNGGPWTSKGIYEANGTNGTFLPTGEVIAVNGSLYGATFVGGDYSCGSGAGCGTVFKLSIPKRAGVSTETDLHDFGTGGDGSVPSGPLIHVDSSFLGLTAAGGSGPCDQAGKAGCGTVYSISPPALKGQPWVESLTYSFQGSADGEYPIGPLVRVGKILYGATAYGGKYGFGTVFSIDGKGREKVVYAFRGGRDGNYPTGIVASGNTLFGVTWYGGGTGCGGTGCGTVFEIQP